MQLSDTGEGMNRFAIITLCIGSCLVASPAQAYIDPGTGGVLVQLLTGGVAGLFVLVRLYWHRLAGLFRMTPAAKLPDSRSSDASHGRDGG